MQLSDRLDALTPEDWERLDAALDELLDLDADARRHRLDIIAEDRPEDAALLDHLLRAEADDARLDRHVRSTLSFLAEQDSPPPGTRIGPWSLLRPIGRGGMSEVFLAERADGAFQRRVALKLLWPGLLGENGERFVRQERQILADLDDPRIAGLVDGGIHDDSRPWLAMDYIEGEHIVDACRLRGVDLSVRLRWIAELARAIASAHRQLIVHGDIKPANVLVTEDGAIRLLDFGIGQLLQRTGHREQGDGAWAALTPSSASPEQRAGRPLTPASDIYQLGLLLGTVLQDLPRMDGRRSREIDAIVQRATAPDPRDRYPSADRMADDIDALLDRRPVAALHAGWLYRARCLLHRRWPSLVLAALLVAIGAGLLAHQLQQARLLAERNATTEAVLGYLEGMLNQSNPQREDRADVLREDLLDAAAAGLEQALGDQPRARTRVLLALGGIHQSRNESMKAGLRYAEAREIASSNQWPEGLDQALAGLAAVGAWTGDYAQSERDLRALIALRIERSSGPDLIANARLQLADLLHSRGMYEDALEQAEQAQAIDNDPALSHRLIGMILRDQGRFDAAEKQLDASLAIENARSPRVDPRLTILADNRGLLMLHQGRFDAAERTIRASEDLRRGYLGENWNGLWWSHHWNGLQALASGQPDRAASLLDRIRVDYRRDLGESSHLLAFARSDRAWVALAQGDRRLAGSLFDQAAARLETMQQGDHPRLAEVRLGQAMLALAEGRELPARRAAEHALRIRNALPSGPGATAWQGNACRVVGWAGGQCDIDDSAFATDGLDTRRIRWALDGLCTDSSATRNSTAGLPCSSS